MHSCSATPVRRLSSNFGATPTKSSLSRAWMGARLRTPYKSQQVRLRRQGRWNDQPHTSCTLCLQPCLPAATGLKQPTCGSGVVSVVCNNNGSLLKGSSDRRLKENIAELSSATETIKQLRPVSDTTGSTKKSAAPKTKLASSHRRSNLLSPKRSSNPEDPGHQEAEFAVPDPDSDGIYGMKNADYAVTITLC